MSKITSSEPVTIQTESENGLGQRAVSGAFIVAVSKMLRYGMIILMHVTLMNYLNPADYGLMRYVTFILGLLMMVSDSGLSTAIIQRKTMSSTLLASASVLNLVITLVCYGTVYLFSPIVAMFYDQPQLTDLIRIGALSFIFANLVAIHRAQLFRSMRFSKLSLIEVFSSAISMFVAVWMARSGHGVWSMVFGLITFNAFQAIMIIIFVKWPGISFREMQQSLQMFLFGLAVAGQRIVGYLYSNTDYLIIGKKFGEQMLGYYGIAFIIVTAPQVTFGIIIAHVAASFFSRIQGDTERTTRSYLFISQVLVSSALLFLVLVFVLAPDLMQLVTFLRPSGKWLPSAPYIRLLAMLGAVYASYGLPETVWIANGKAKLSLYLGIFGVATVFAAVYIGSLFSIKAVCIALTVRALLLFPVLLHFNRKIFNCSPWDYLKVLFPPYASSIMTLLVLIMFGKVQIFKVLPIRIISTIALGTTIYIGLYFLFFKSQFMFMASFVKNSFRGLFQKPKVAFVSEQE